MNPRPARFRFGLRSLLGLVFVVALFAAFPFLLHVLAWLVWFTGPLLAIAAFVIVRNATCSQPSGDFKRWPTIADWFLFAVATVPLLACWFIRYRWVNAFSDDEWPRPFPYPDVYLNKIHDWWDRLHPVTDALKMHGEYYAVLQGTNALLLVACITFGAVAGYVFRDGDFLAASRGLTWFCRRGPSGMQLIDIRMRDGSRHFVSLPESVPWSILRDHIASLDGAKVTDFITDNVTEVWIDFELPNYRFTINNQFGEYWFFVDDPLCPAETLDHVARHCAQLLG